MSTNQFNDTKERPWTVTLDWVKLREIRKATKLDFGEVEQFGSIWATILNSDQTALDVLWIAISDRAGDATKDDWLAAMNGDTLEAGADALLEAVKLFTRPQKRGMIEAGAERIHKAFGKACQAATNRIGEMTEETIQEYHKQLGTQPQRSQEYSDTSTTAGP